MQSLEEISWYESVARNVATSLGNLVIKTGDICSHIIAAGLGMDAVRNLYNGISTGNTSYYQLAALEGIASVGIEVSKYLDRRKQRDSNESIEKIQVLIGGIKEVEQELNDSFQELFDKMDDYQG